MASGVTVRDAFPDLAPYSAENIVKQALITDYEKVRNIYAQFYEKYKGGLSPQKQEDLNPDKLMSCDSFTTLIDKAMCFGAIVHYSDQLVKIRRCFESFSS